jgi:hypothetical protein
MIDIARLTDNPIITGMVGRAVAVTNAVGITVESSDELKTSRLAICDTCDKKGSAVCGVCGCVLSAKAALKNSSCPLGKW